jgi:hypothetical protein
MKNVYWFGSRVFFSMALALTGLLMTAALSSAADSDCKKIEESPGTWGCLNVPCDNMFYTCKKYLGVSGCICLCRVGPNVACSL